MRQFLPPAALAHSVAAGYRVPTNMQFVERGKLILPGTVPPEA